MKLKFNIFVNDIFGKLTDYRTEKRPFISGEPLALA